MDKLAKVRAEVERLDNEWYLCNSSEAKYKRETYKEILDFINSLQQEPVSEDLEKAAKDYSNNLDNIRGSMGEQTRNAFKAGAEWRKEQITESLLSEVLSCFMHGGEADEVVAKLDEVLTDKDI